MRKILLTKLCFAISVLSAYPAYGITEVEPNNSFIDRQVLPSDAASVNGSISPGDVDFFTFTGLEAGASFVAEFIQGNFDSILGRLDDEGNLLGTDDDGGDRPLSRLSGIVPESGNVNLGLTGFSDFSLVGDHFESGDYELSVNTFPSVNLDYSVTEVPFVFEDISTTGTRVLAGADDETVSAELGFTFNFFGQDFNSISWSPNGLLTFGGSSGQFANVNLLSEESDDLPIIAPLWDDWQFFSPGTDASYLQALGESGQQRFIIQWNLAEGFPDSPSAVTFQTVLFEESNEILFSYLDVDSEDFRAFGNDATIGIRDAFGSQRGEVLQFSFNTPAIRNRQALLFSPEVVSEPVPEPASLLGLFAFGMLGAGSILTRKSQK
ncbi:PEP-CTERM sorting domain-containing protein [Leptolyngbya sp. FACHB-671]|uniref:PEP-CTERM sorting domain-containing protein n=1 Tax=Leptolyngbya sp. FACHB-671 TaxID=2692812 RepID=UPI001687D2B9|nr:PEP-CTERM sorting domain-containing protein [Leptolyngbya sp. FACHB-671]MBD1869403.1 PEP-CTERM sorting domain-containing protein [Cyanobacteria bacterium FACHB-471]MBD2071192.1 PEP-CTERM sorting domain-containing protein [Leptolyngbya sp. FACHB-671]